MLQTNLGAIDESLAYIKALGKKTGYDVLAEQRRAGKVAIQPRVGVGGFDPMLDLLKRFEREASPEVLTITIDSHTRLKKFATALQVLNSDASQLNGFPLVAHGWEKGRMLNEAITAPIQIRHGSPDARALFLVALRAGFTMFEGGGISYNLPYCKNVSLADSLSAWRQVDEVCGYCASQGVVIDRELFGTLSAVLVPPAISIAVSLIEACLAARESVRCISISYPQGGHLEQDMAAIRSIGKLCARYLPPTTEVFTVLHEFMGVFPRSKAKSRLLISYGGLLAKLGGADKVITKTAEEAHGIPTAEANIEGMMLNRRAMDRYGDEFEIDWDRVDEEELWIMREVAELVDPIVGQDDMESATIGAFAKGHLDIPFSASRQAKSLVVPLRDKSGAIRIYDAGNTSLSDVSRARNAKLLEGIEHARVAKSLVNDINFFA